MKKLSHDKAEDLKLIAQCIDCFHAIPGMKPDKTDDEWSIELARTLYKKFPENTQDLGAKLSAMDSLEPKEDEERYETALYNKIIRYFSKTVDLLRARTQSDRKKIRIADHSVDYAERMLERLHTEQKGETKDITASALKEFAAAAYIARCDNLEITKDEAHKALEEKGKRK